MLAVLVLAAFPIGPSRASSLVIVPPTIFVPPFGGAVYVRHGASTDSPCGNLSGNWVHNLSWNLSGIGKATGQARGAGCPTGTTVTRSSTWLSLQYRSANFTVNTTRWHKVSVNWLINYHAFLSGSVGSNSSYNGHKNFAKATISLLEFAIVWCPGGTHHPLWGQNWTPYVVGVSGDGVWVSPSGKSGPVNYGFNDLRHKLDFYHEVHMISGKQCFMATTVFILMQAITLGSSSHAVAQIFFAAPQLSIDLERWGVVT